MDTFARLSLADRRELFRETAARKGFASTVVVEKDFWVCWTLKHLFALEGVPPLLFKGGTSLSKGFGLIDRFSEDIDVSIDRKGLGFGGPEDPAAMESRKARERATQALCVACSDFVRGDLRRALEQSFASSLDETFVLRVEQTAKNSCDLVFEYPAALDEPDYGLAGYISPAVRLEFGARSDHEPVVERDVRSFVADEFPQAFTDPATRVRILAPERTFWEKATILHAENHRQERDDGTLPSQWTRLSRHAYDLHMMIERGVGPNALRRQDLLDQVAEHKSTFFYSAWAKYDLACQGTLRLVPRRKFSDALRADYRAMREMFAGDPPSFEAILESLTTFEAQLNRAP